MRQKRSRKNKPREALLIVVWALSAAEVTLGAYGGCTGARYAVFNLVAEGNAI